ncbi:MAG: sensor histidine kinase [Eubacteriales bacterium]|nr:sensor histidine kinase [Eubacteriales bacterium]
MWKNEKKKRRLEDKMRALLLTTMIPVILIMAVLLFMFWQYTKRYSELSYNLAVSSEFNLSFKDDIDERIYYVAIGSKGEETLPYYLVLEAVDTVERLEKTTNRRESKRSIYNLKSYLSNLEDYMNQLMETEKYDDRISLLENYIYMCTSLIVEEMQNYIYEESMNLVEVEAELTNTGKMLVMGMAVLVLLTVLILMRRFFWFSRKITEPVTEILNNVKAVGKGNFNMREVETDSLEIQELDAGTRKMAERIQLLLENVKKEQEMQHLTELQLIQAQVNPHFLYNTLDTIVWLIEGGQDEDALNMITSLSVFFRTSLSKGKDIITLEEEERHTLSYLEIQKFRYRDILDFEIRIPDSLKKILVPKLTLQPLAENALYHGIKNKRGKGKILIEGIDSGEDLILRVTDTGQGMTEERLREVQNAIKTGERTGFGLAAVSERIRLYYGSGYGLKISSKEGEGTVMEVYLAKKMQNGDAS